MMLPKGRVTKYIHISRGFLFGSLVLKDWVEHDFNVWDWDLEKKTYLDLPKGAT